MRHIHGSHIAVGRLQLQSRQCSQGIMNGDEGAYQLSHVYDNLLFSMATSGGEQQTAVRERQQLLSKRHWKFSELLTVVLRF